VTGAELLRAAEGSPLLLAFLTVGGFLSYAVERLCGSNGPATRLLHAWRDRELRELRREALLRAERRRIDRDEATAREAEQLAELTHLRRRVIELTGDRDTLLREVEHANRRASAAHPTLPVPRLADDPVTAPLHRRRRESARPPPPGR
jgi:hypothetical protein